MAEVNSLLGAKPQDAPSPPPDRVDAPAPSQDESPQTATDQAPPEQAPEPAAGDDLQGEGGDQGADQPESDTGAVELSIKGVAEKLGTTPEKLYEMEIGPGDGETVTLGALKDAYATRQAAELETAEQTAANRERETVLSRDQQLLGMAMQELGTRLTPQLEHRVRARADEMQAQQRQLMMQVLPELSDSAKLDSFRESVVTGLKEYGFQAHELNFSDHRMVWVLRDMMRDKAELKALRANKPKPEPKPLPRTHRPRGKTGTGGGAQAAINRARDSGLESDKLAAVGALLKG
jgi:hypothetical protein